jgi:hypothetical protein
MILLYCLNPFCRPHADSNKVAPYAIYRAALECVSLSAGPRVVGINYATSPPDRPTAVAVPMPAPIDAVLKRALRLLGAHEADDTSFNQDGGPRPYLMISHHGLRVVSFSSGSLFQS